MARLVAEAVFDAMRSRADQLPDSEAGTSGEPTQPDTERAANDGKKRVTPVKVSKKELPRGQGFAMDLEAQMEELEFSRTVKEIAEKKKEELNSKVMPFNEVAELADSIYEEAAATAAAEFVERKKAGHAKYVKARSVEELPLQSQRDLRNPIVAELKRKYPESIISLLIFEVAQAQAARTLESVELAFDPAAAAAAAAAAADDGDDDEEDEEDEDDDFVEDDVPAAARPVYDRDADFVKMDDYGWLTETYTWNGLVYEHKETRVLGDMVRMVYEFLASDESKGKDEDAVANKRVQELVNEVLLKHSVLMPKDRKAADPALTELWKDVAALQEQTEQAAGAGAERQS